MCSCGLFYFCREVDSWPLRFSNDCKFVYFRTEVDVLVLDFTRNAVCVMSARNGHRISRTTCETKKAKGKRPVTNTGRTRKSKGPSSRAYSLPSCWKNPNKIRASFWASSHTPYWEDPRDENGTNTLTLQGFLYQLYLTAWWAMYLPPTIHNLHTPAHHVYL